MMVGSPAGSQSLNSPQTGAKTSATIQAKPNLKTEVTVSEYEPLSVEVKTTSVVDGTNRVIKVTQDNIYPGKSCFDIFICFQFIELFQAVINLCHL